MLKFHRIHCKNICNIYCKLQKDLQKKYVPIIVNAIIYFKNVHKEKSNKNKRIGILINTLRIVFAILQNIHVNLFSFECKQI